MEKEYSLYLSDSMQLLGIFGTKKECHEYTYYYRESFKELDNSSIAYYIIECKDSSEKRENKIFYYSKNKKLIDTFCE